MVRAWCGHGDEEGKPLISIERCTHLLTKPLCLAGQRRAVCPVFFLSDKYGRRRSEMLYETRPLESALWSRAIPLLHFIGRTNTVDFFLTHTIYFFFYLSGRIAGTPDCLGKRVIHSSIITRGIVSCDTNFPPYNQEVVTWHLTRIKTFPTQLQE